MVLTGMPVSEWQEAAPVDPDLMFYIQRNIDDRQVHYVLNRAENGSMDSSDPFDVFWTSVSDAKKRRRLNLVQRRFVYGVTVKSIEPGHIEFRLAAYPELSLFLRQTSTDQYRVYTHINGVWCILRRIHVQLADENVFSPTVVYVKLEGVDDAGHLHSEQIRR